MRCREENFLVFMYVLRSIVTPWSGLRNSRDQNHAHIYFVIFPWLVLYVALVYLIHRWTMLEKMRETLSEAILVAICIKVLMHSRPQRLRSIWPAPWIETSGRLQFSVRDSRTSDLSAQSRTFIKMVDQAINFGQEIQNFSDIT